SKTTEELKLEWKTDRPVTTPGNPYLSLFLLVDVVTSRCKENETLPTVIYTVEHFLEAMNLGGSNKDFAKWKNSIADGRMWIVSCLAHADI
ncbi:unnamed protein product, partial [Allacma fusca]